MKVIVTRPRDQAGPLVARLEELGLEVVECPLIEIDPFDDAIDVEGYEWVIVTSPNGARAGAQGERLVAQGGGRRAGHGGDSP